jgi:hypothetical protein
MNFDVECADIFLFANNVSIFKKISVLTANLFSMFVNTSAALCCFPIYFQFAQRHFKTRHLSLCLVIEMCRMVQ